MDLIEENRGLRSTVHYETMQNRSLTTTFPDCFESLPAKLTVPLVGFLYRDLTAE